MKNFLIILLALMLMGLRYVPDYGIPPDKNYLVPAFPTIPGAPVIQKFGYLGHVGIDFYVKVGSAVYADLDGIITDTTLSTGVYGRYLTLTHPDGYVSLYAHLAAFKVKRGDNVVSGQLIALSGGDPNDNIDGDGNSRGPHLHWEVRPVGHTDTNKYNVDPILYLLSFVQNGLWKNILNFGKG